MGAYVYNASGELIRLEATEGNTVFSSGELGVINSVTLPSSQSINYKTDYSARRVGKINSLSQNYRRIYQNELQVAAELNGTELSEFFYVSSINSPELMKKGDDTFRIIQDHLGSPVLVINTADGTIEAQAQYSEWGRVIEESNAGFIPFGFAGGLRDLDTGLVRFGARDYNPNTARWISKDPIGFNGGDANLYRYVGNDPVNFFDPTGLSVADRTREAIDNARKAILDSYNNAKGRVKRNFKRIVNFIDNALDDVEEKLDEGDMEKDRDSDSSRNNSSGSSSSGTASSSNGESACPNS